MYNYPDSFVLIFYSFGSHMQCLSYTLDIYWPEDEKLRRVPATTLWPSLNHVIVGAGVPSATHCSSARPPLFSVRFSGCAVKLGATVKISYYYTQIINVQISLLMFKIIQISLPSCISGLCYFLCLSVFNGLVLASSNQIQAEVSILCPGYVQFPCQYHTKWKQNHPTLIKFWQNW
jgi:hypothetical protein